MSRTGSQLTAGRSSTETRWILITESGTSASGKTRTWTVTTREGGVFLGTVKWWSRWRKYAFFPAHDSLFEEDCLRDIATFVQNRTLEHQSFLAATRSTQL